MLIPNAPSPAKPITGVSGQPILAPNIEGKPYPHGPNNLGMLKIFVLLKI